MAADNITRAVGSWVNVANAAQQTAQDIAKAREAEQQSKLTPTVTPAPQPAKP